MSDLGFTFTQAMPLASVTTRPRVSLVEALGQPGGFRPSARFGGPGGMVAAHHELAIVETHAPDPAAEAYARGYAEGHAQALEEAEAHAAAAEATRGALALSFARLDAVLEEDLRLRLRDTVAALCEAALAPLAIDEAALARRIERAVAMLARADDERVLRLHPEDMAMVSERLPAEWNVVTDAALERGTVRVEGAMGGVEDGPASWRMAIAEALHEG
ncbi:MAG TPA: FliH/SctL family protein [Novosphingobium sp.]|nr:FliH/SctL family protein [Novosphingobium sp.]